MEDSWYFGFLGTSNEDRAISQFCNKLTDADPLGSLLLPYSPFAFKKPIVNSSRTLLNGEAVEVLSSSVGAEFPPATIPSFSADDPAQIASREVL